MKQSELRLGNIIEIYSLLLKKYIVIDKKTLIMLLLEESENVSEIYRPVIITDELLLKIDADTPIKLHEKGGVVILGGLQRHIFYLHQLQNLWFALVGTELKVNL